MVKNKYKVSTTLSFSCQGHFQDFPIDIVIEAENMDEVRTIASYIKLNKVKINSIKKYEQDEI